MEELIDKQAISLLVSQLGLPMVTDVVKAFVPDAKNNIHYLQTHWQAGEYHDLRIKSHSLKSAAANIGLKQLSSLAKKLEQFCISHEEHDFQLNQAELAQLSVLLEDSLKQLSLMGINQDTNP